MKFRTHFSAIYGLSPFDFCCVDKNESAGQARRARFVFVLFQSFQRLPEEIVKTFTHVIFDEVHHILAESWNKVYKRLRASHSLQYMLAMTATLQHRSDPSGKKLKSLFENMVYIDFPLTTAKKLGYFPKVDYIESLPTLKNGRDVPTYSAILREFRQGRQSLAGFLRRLEKSLEQMSMGSGKDIRKRLKPEFIVDTLVQLNTLREKPLKKIIIFAQNAAHATNIANLCNQKGLSAGAVHYKVHERQVERIFASFNNGRLNVFVNVNVLSEGYDLPTVDCVVLARMTQSEIVFVQQIGRGLRRDLSNPDKEVVILDLALNLRRRWRLLRATLPDPVVQQLAHEFWHVNNFLGFLDFGEF